VMPWFAATLESSARVHAFVSSSGTKVSWFRLFET
jgi:hypothetical protein